MAQQAKTAKPDSMSSIPGIHTVEEVKQFTQTDLCPTQHPNINNKKTHSHHVPLCLTSFVCFTESHVCSLG